MINTVIKRDGERHEAFDTRKVHSAVYRCLTNGVGMETSAADGWASLVATQLENILSLREGELKVEDLQTIIVNQLMANNLFDAARAYNTHREKQRMARLLKPIAEEDRDMFRRMKRVFKDPVGVFQFLNKYARFRPDVGRRENWDEACDRVVSFLAKHIARLPSVPKDNVQFLMDLIYGELREAIYSLQAFPSMRLMQMAGPAAERCHVSIYNCSYLPIDSIQAFTEVLYILMQGTGVGFSVERQFVSRLPRVKYQKEGFIPATHVVEDSTEGWCEALRLGLEAWFNGKDLWFDYSQVRPKGTVLRTKGGRASGPEPLKNLLDFARSRILERQGGVLSALDVHDITCMIGKIVEVGGVRRAALISLSDLDDREMAEAKMGTFWNTAIQRFQANNSAVYEKKPGVVEFMQEMLALIKSNSGERGIHNREGALRTLPERRKKLMRGLAKWLTKLGLNPCGEILLLACEFCNLSIAVARPEDTAEDLKRKVRWAAIFGTLQSTMTNFRYIRNVWRDNCERERLLGVDITGQMDCPLLRPGAPGRLELLEELKRIAVATNEWMAGLLGINPSAAVTCVKPSGNSAQLLGCSSGLHTRFAKYYLRRTKCSRMDPMAQLLIDEGVPWHPDTGEDPLHPNTIVFEWVVKSPDGAPTRDDYTAIEQLENWLQIKEHYTEHNPSATVYVKPEEWIPVINWVYARWDQVGGLSFLPYDGGCYPLMPYEEISEEEYHRLSAAFPDIAWEKLCRYEDGEDHTTGAQELACVGGACEI